MLSLLYGHDLTVNVCPIYASRVLFKTSCRVSSSTPIHLHWFILLIAKPTTSHCLFLTAAVSFLPPWRWHSLLSRLLPWELEWVMDKYVGCIYPFISSKRLLGTNYACSSLNSTSISKFFCSVNHLESLLNHEDPVLVLPCTGCWLVVRIN